MRKLFIFVLLVFGSLLFAFGQTEFYSDPLFEQKFPTKLGQRQSLPPSVDMGSILIRGGLVSLGSTPFTQTALKVEQDGDSYYFILPNNFWEIVSDHEDHLNEQSEDTDHHNSVFTEDGEIDENLHQELHREDSIVSGNLFEIRGQLSIVPKYFIDNRFAMVEYHLKEIESVELVNL